MIENIREFLNLGGAAMWVIAGLSLLMTALIIWKLLRFAGSGVFSRSVMKRLDHTPISGRSVRAKLAQFAQNIPATEPLEARREVYIQEAKSALFDARQGLRILEMIAVIAPLVGLLGTVLGMIEAFQALEAAGGKSDPTILAGGIWEALLTTAAGMAVTIPASIALAYFDGKIDCLRLDFETIGTRLLH